MASFPIVLLRNVFWIGHSKVFVLSIGTGAFVLVNKCLVLEVQVMICHINDPNFFFFCYLYI